jgi:hypothetical protein
LVPAAEQISARVEGLGDDAAESIDDRRQVVRRIVLERRRVAKCVPRLQDLPIRGERQRRHVTVGHFLSHEEAV